MKEIDINVDIGEGFGRYRIGNDEAVMKHATSANIATGFHGGDSAIMLDTVRLAKKYNVAVGAHPALQDLRGFGRRRILIDPDELYPDLLYQIGALDGIARSEGLKVEHVKLHGALYAMTEDTDRYAEAAASAIHSYRPDLIVITERETEMQKAAEKAGLRVAIEAFPDLKYTAQGKIIIERTKEVWDPELVAERSLRLVRDGYIDMVDGGRLKTEVSTICLHSDAPNAPAIIERVRSRLGENGIGFRKIGEILGGVA